MENSRNDSTGSGARDRPRVSVVLNFLNGEPFLEEAIASVLDQTYTGWELLLVDDGSTDESTARARQYAAAYPDKITYLEHAGHANRGQNASRNLGICNARGDYVAFLDADDVWLPHKLEQQVAILDSEPEAAMVYGLSQFWYSWTGDAKDQHRDFVFELGVPKNSLIQPPHLLIPFFFSQTAAIPSPTNILVRRESLARVGNFDEQFRLYTDQNLYAKICLQEPVFAADQCWDRYRQHRNSVLATAQRQGRELQWRVFFLEWLATYLSTRGVTDPEIWHALKRELWRCRHPRLHRARERGRRGLRAVGGELREPIRRLVPAPWRWWLSARIGGQTDAPPVGWVRLGDLRRLTPFSRQFGFERGLPVDRYYIEQFLSEHAADIKGDVLEIEDDTYARRFGGSSLRSVEVLHVTGNDRSTIVADLRCAEHVPTASFDCVILTQTLQFIFEVPAALSTVRRILRPGGVVLATLPGLSQISRYDFERWGHFWSFTSQSARRLFEQVFPPQFVSVGTHGNVLAATALLYGMASQELDRRELDHADPDYQVIISVRAVKPLLDA